MWTTAVVCCAAATLYYTMALPTPDDSTERVMQPISAAMTGNYTISFMPLLSVLVNMFPRLMSRVRLQPLTSTTHARKLEALWEWERASLCAIVETEGWSNGDDPCHFYTCTFSSKSYCSEQIREPKKDYGDTLLVSSAELDECTVLEVRRCQDPTYKYSSQLSRCVAVPTDQDGGLMCDQTNQ